MGYLIQDNSDIPDSSNIGRIEIKGKWPNISVWINDQQVDSSQLHDVNVFLSANSIPVVSLEFTLLDVDIDVEDTFLEGSIRLGKNDDILQVEKVLVHKEFSGK